MPLACYIVLADDPAEAIRCVADDPDDVIEYFRQSGRGPLFVRSLTPLRALVRPEGAVRLRRTDRGIKRCRRGPAPEDLDELRRQDLQQVAVEFLWW